jgi:hypothetical protein
MWLSPDALHRFFSPRPGIYDTEHYENIARAGYYYIPSVAFYPLWPLIGRFLFGHLSGDMTYYLSRFSACLFFISIPLLYQTFKQALNPRLAWMVVLAFAINPMSIPHVIGYTESLFSLFSAIFFWSLLPGNKLSPQWRAIALFGTSFLMSLTRPVLLMLLVGSLAAYATILLFAAIKNRSTKLLDLAKNNLDVLNATGTIWIGAISGYSLYGFYCLQARGNFFAPFDAQKYWFNKRLGIHWLQISTHFSNYLWDLLALYIPILLLVFALIFVYLQVSQKQLSNRFKPLQKIYQSLDPQAETLSTNYLFWLCAYFTVCFPIITLFTQDHLASLGRHVFGIPFVFLTIGYFCLYFPSRTINKIMFVLIVASGITLIQWWGRYGIYTWIG